MKPYLIAVPVALLGLTLLVLFPLGTVLGVIFTAALGRVIQSIPRKR
jgi:hypothetical protein